MPPPTNRKQQGELRFWKKLQQSGGERRQRGCTFARNTQPNSRTTDGLGHFRETRSRRRRAWDAPLIYSLDVRGKTNQIRAITEKHLGGKLAGGGEGRLVCLQGPPWKTFSRARSKALTFVDEISIYSPVYTSPGLHRNATHGWMRLRLRPPRRQKPTCHGRRCFLSGCC